MAGPSTFPPYWQPPWPGWTADPIEPTASTGPAPSKGIDVGDATDLPGWALPAPPPHPALPLLASPRDRVAAHLIDLLVLAPVMVPLGLTGVFAYVKLTELDAPFGIRVMKDDGRPIAWTDAQTRWLYVPTDYASMAGLTLISTDPLRQRLGDHAAGTIVVRAG